VQGVEDCTASFLPISTEIQVEETEQLQDQIEEFMAADPSLPTSRVVNGNGLSFRYDLKIFVPCTLAYFGQLVFMVLQRWVDSQNADFFMSVYRGSTILTFW
jgi:hypothetical protein